MTNKNHSKSDKKTRKYKQRRAQLLAEVAQLKKEGEEQSKKTDKKFEEVAEKFEEVGEKFEEVAEQQKETDKKIKELGKEVKEVVEGLRQVRIGIEYHGEQIGGLGNKLGGYTEAMAMPSIRGILDRRFDANFEGSLLVRNTNNQLDMEVDAWGVSRNGTGAAYIVEIKSKFHNDHIKQVWQLVRRFRDNRSEYRRRAVFPILAVVDISEEGRATVWNAGIHLIDINDGVFRYAMPPQDFEANGYHGMRGVRKDVPHLRAVPG